MYEKVDPQSRVIINLALVLDNIDKKIDKARAHLHGAKCPEKLEFFSREIEFLGMLKMALTIEDEEDEDA